MANVLRLSAPVTLEAAHGGTKPRRLTIKAYTGKVTRPANFGHADALFVVDGMELPTSLPILDSHENSLSTLIGEGKPTRAGAGGIDVAATVGPGPAGERTLAFLDAGFALQASVGLVVMAGRWAKAGETIAANGTTFTAGKDGLYVAEKTILREVSVVPAAADADTSVSIALALTKGASMDNPVTLPTNDPATVAELAVAQERQRMREIDKVASHIQLRAGYANQLSELKAKAVNGDISLDTLRAGALELIKAQQTVGPLILTPRAETLNQSTTDHMTAALMVRSGHAAAAEKAFGADVMEQSKHLHRSSVVDIVRASLIAGGHPVPSGGSQVILQAGASTLSLPTALGNTMNKVLLSSYQSAPSAWRQFAAVKPANDFKTQTGIRPSFAVSLSLVPPGGEVKHGTAGEETFPWSIATYARQLAITRHDLINDDLGAFSETAPAMGRAASRAVSDLVITTMLADVAAGTFWTSGHANYFEGSGTNLQASSLATAILKMRQMTDAEGNLIDLQPAVLVVPPELEFTAKALLATGTLSRVSSGDNLPESNPFAQIASLAVEPRLSNANYTGYSAVAWYLFAAPSNAAVIVGFLGGIDSPTIETFESGADTLDFSTRVVLDFGAALGDFRAAIKSKGSA